MRSHVFRHNVYFIGLVSLIYSALTVMAAGCALTHTDRSQNHQHHHNEKGSSDHSVLCVWACQATADAAEAGGSPSIVTELAVGSVDLARSSFAFSTTLSPILSRAPPSVLFVRIG